MILNTTDTPVHAAINAEKALLSCMMQNGTNIARALNEGLTHAHFWMPAHAKIFDDLCELHRQGEAFDIVAYGERLNAKGEFDTIGGPATIGEVYTFAITSGPWAAWLEIVRDAKVRRDVQQAMQDLAQCQSGEESVRLLQEALETLSASLSGPAQCAAAKEAARDFVEHIETLAHNGAIPGLETGFAELDARCGGMRPGELWVTAGLPSRGKSVLLLQVACHALRQQKRVAIFSLEMMNHEVVGRCVSTVGSVEYSSITQPRSATKQDLIKIQRTVGELAQTQLWINDAPDQTIDSIVSEALRLRDLNGGLDLIVVDYLQLINGDRKRNENREQEIARVSRGLKQLAKKLHCPVLTASQLNDEGRVRESRAIEQDADALLYITDDGVKIYKLRNGQRNSTLSLKLNGRYQRFEYSFVGNAESPKAKNLDDFRKGGDRSAN